MQRGMDRSCLRSLIYYRGELSFEFHINYSFFPLLYWVFDIFVGLHGLSTRRSTSCSSYIVYFAHILFRYNFIYQWIKHEHWTCMLRKQRVLFLANLRDFFCSSCSILQLVLLTVISTYRWQSCGWTLKNLIVFQLGSPNCGVTLRP